MNTLFFAARRQHLHYFSQLAINLNNQGIASQVVWHKDLVFSTFWLVSLFSTRPDLTPVLSDHLKEKQNSPRGKRRSPLYWRLLFGLKSVEAKLLFAIYYQAFRSRKTGTLVIWNGLKFRQRLAIAAAEAAGARTLVMENGLLPGMTTLDPKGVNFINSVPRDPSFFLPYSDQHPWVTPENTSPRPEGLPEHYIFVPFQVNTDSQIVLFSDWIQDMFTLVQVLLTAEETLGDAMPHIVMKTHPACDQDYRALARDLQQHSRRITLLDSGDTPALIAHADAVITINSTVGIEAIASNKRTLVLGQAFYDMPGLTMSAHNQEALIRALPEISHFSPNPTLRLGFLNYLKHHYQVPGRWQTASGEHCQAAAERIAGLLNPNG